ncbi:hypothetical protein ABW20_dc0101395 [Dactylellina cionopaga]|nr:hypothetical protein ABW20_dc0101395 [Dactylellina cionopaga]
MSPVSKLIRGVKQRNKEENKGAAKTANLPAEILEQIILNVPAIEVLTTCRRVCKTWKILVETSSPLNFYSTTGLSYSDKHRAERADSLPQVTPMAVAVLHKFWKKLALEGLEPNTKLPPPEWLTSVSDLLKRLLKGIGRFLRPVFKHPQFRGFEWWRWIVFPPLILPIWAFRSVRDFILARWAPQSDVTDFQLGSLLPPTPRQVFKRTKVQRIVKKLLKQFKGVMRVVPFITQPGYTADMNIITTFHSCNKNLDKNLLSRGNWKSVPDIYFKIALGLTRALYEHNCRHAHIKGRSDGHWRHYRPRENPGILFRFAFKNNRSEAERATGTGPCFGDPALRQTVDFGLRARFDVEVGKEPEFFLYHFKTQVAGYEYIGGAQVSF